MTGGEYRESRAGHEAGRRMLSVNIVASTQAFRENPAVVNIGGGPYQNRVGKQLGWMPFGASKTDSDELIMHWILFFFFWAAKESGAFVVGHSSARGGIFQHRPDLQSFA